MSVLLFLIQPDCECTIPCVFAVPNGRCRNTAPEMEPFSSTSVVRGCEMWDALGTTQKDVQPLNRFDLYNSNHYAAGTCMFECMCVSVWSGTAAFTMHPLPLCGFHAHAATGKPRHEMHISWFGCGTISAPCSTSLRIYAVDAGSTHHHITVHIHTYYRVWKYWSKSSS